MNVSSIARRAGTTAETVRHYTDLGLLSPTRNPENGYRVYNKDDLQTLKFALNARSLGFTLADIQQLVDRARLGKAPCQHTRALIEARLQDVETQITELQALSQRMRRAMDSWADSPDCGPEGNAHVCGLIESFEVEPEHV